MDMAFSLFVEDDIYKWIAPRKARGQWITTEEYFPYYVAIIAPDLISFWKLLESCLEIRKITKIDLTAK